MQQRIQFDFPGTVRVELTNRPGQFALIDRADFEQWTAEGRSTRWLLNGAGGYEYVRVHDPEWAGGLVSVARLLLRAKDGRIVKYANGDRLDLRRSNLWMTDGYAPGRSRAWEDEFAAAA